MFSHAAARDEAGRTLYEERSRRLPGLGQPPAPPWTDLEEPVRERWRRHAEAYRPVGGTPTAKETRAVRERSPARDTTPAPDTTTAPDTPGTPRNGGRLRFPHRVGR